MSKLCKSNGNMYEWVTNMWSPIVGCPHQCSYCYVKNEYRDLPETSEIDLPFPNLGEGKVIFVGHLCDMWAETVKDSDILDILAHCMKYPENQYMFQTKNPEKYEKYLSQLKKLNIYSLGTTIETDDNKLIKEISKAPDITSRINGITKAKKEGFKTFITIEPIMDFNPRNFIDMLKIANPDFINIGADSKRHSLKEPEVWKVKLLIEELQKTKIEIRKKHNLLRFGFKDQEHSL